MPTVELDGIRTHYETRGEGPPLLMFSPGGFNAVVEGWNNVGIYPRLNLLQHLMASYTCLVFDRREAGKSGGRVERLTWDAYAAQAVALLDHLGVEVAHLMGGCVGCSSVLAVARQSPERVGGLVLYSPAGGPRYRMAQQDRFMRHLVFVREYGLEAVVELARQTEATFNQEPRNGPWAAPLQTDEQFVADYLAQDVDQYMVKVLGSMRGLFDRDTVPGVEPEAALCLDMPALIVPGDDASHAPSAARYLQECLPASTYWDMSVEHQTEATAPPVVLEFLADVASTRLR